METQKRTMPEGYTVTRSAGSPKIFRKWEEYKIGDVIVGKINGSNEQTKFLTPGQPPKMSAIVEVLESFLKGEDNSKFKGKNLVLNSTAVLEKLMIEVGIYNKSTRTFKEGEVIQIEYAGKETVQNGDYKGKDAHIFKLDVLGAATPNYDESSDL